MVYILSRIVDKFFLRSAALTVNEHADFALLGLDHHRLAAHATHHVKGVYGLAAKGKLKGILLDSPFDRLPQFVGDLEEPVRRTKPPDPLVRALVVVVLDPKGGALHRLIEAAKLRPLQELSQDRLPEAFDLAKRHRVVGPGADMLDALFRELLLKARLPAPVGVLPPVVGQHLLGNPVFGHRPAVALEHVLRRLAAVKPQGGDVAAVVVDEADQVSVLAPQPEGHDVALSQLVRTGPLEEPRLARVLLRLRRPILNQPPRGERLMHPRGTGAHQKEALEHIGDPPGAVLRVRRLHRHRLMPNLLGNTALAAYRTLGLKPRRPVKPKGLHPARNRVRADPKLLDQQAAAGGSPLPGKA
jgi:hypothetical protein